MNEHTFAKMADRIDVNEFAAYTPAATSKNLAAIESRVLAAIAAPSKKKLHMGLRRTALTAACVIIVLALSLTALASIGVFDMRTIYESIFTNKKSEMFVSYGNTVADQGIEITPIGVFVDDSNAYVQLSVKDLEGGRLADKVYLYTPSGFDAYYNDVRYGETTDEAIVTNILSLNQNDPTAPVSFEIEAIITGVREVMDEKLNAHVKDYLAITEPVTVPGVPQLSIISASFDNGILTVVSQSAQPEARLFGSGHLDLIDTNGTIIPENSGNMDGDTGLAEATYVLGEKALDDFSFIYSGKISGNVIRGKWKIEAVQPRRIESLEGVRGKIAGRDATMHISAVSLIISVTPGFDDWFSVGSLINKASEEGAVITLSDGTRVQAGRMNADGNSEWAVFEFSIPFTLPSDVASITFLGDVIDVE
ncbi:MAG: DUF4179 domain-containing protein [Oscillospiraceae bacterium]|jgi:hypothetical protein|nr:DUF4179 domain-containing protein [Oscillospiraceae bacterium]